MTGDTIHGRVLAQAARRPHATALSHPGGSLSYRELDLRSAGIADSLRAAGVGPGTVVPVLLPPSPELAVVLLGVLRCGAAYAAVDLAWPAARIGRIARMLAGQLAVLGPAAAPDAFPGRHAVLGADGVLPVDAGPQPPPRLIDADGQAAMVFFTSGSTGEPKAVLSPHRATVRLFDGCTFATFDQGTVMAQLAAVPWDAFAMELWGPLIGGGTSALVTERPVTPAALRELIASRRVDTLFLTTSMFHLVVEEDVDALGSLRTLIAGGEKMSPAHAAVVLRRWPQLRLVNGYGPVESAVFALTHDLGPAEADRDVPLGRPVPRTEVVIMRRGRDFGQLCAPDEVGEICIAGDGLALGYLGNAELTSQRFPTVVVGGRPTRLYRTGDLGSRDGAGVFHFRGRLDRQVKVRGNRVEPGEIEAAATAVPGVSRSLVVPKLDATGAAVGLVLFYSAPEGNPAPAALTESLRGVLPGYAVPDRVERVATFPLTATGKVDAAALLRALPARTAQLPGAGQPPAAGHPALDGDLAAVVAAEAAALLGLAELDRSTSLFSLGATSLTAVRLCSRLGTRFGRPVPVSRLMQDPTIDGLSRWLAGNRPADPAPATSDEQLTEAGAALTAMQASFVLSHLRSGADTDNHCLLGWRVRGPLDAEALAAAVAAVHARHGYLSGRYVMGEDLRVVPGDAPPPLELLSAPDEQRAAELMRARLRTPFELAAGRVWRVVRVDFGDPERCLLGVAVHHAAFDGWSQHLLAAALGQAYAGEVADPATPVPGPGRVHQLVQELGSAADLPRQREHWRHTLAGLPPLCWPTGPTDGPTEPAAAGPRVIELVLDEDAMAAAELAARDQGGTLLTVLLGAVRGAVGRQTGQDDFGVGVPVSQRGTAELHRPIGCLIDTVCVRLRGADEVRPAVEAAIANADLPFAEVVRLLRPKRTGRHPLYQVIAAVQDSPPPCLELAGCRTEPLPDTDVLWPDAEFVVELFTAGAPARLRLSRDPARVGQGTFERLACEIHDRLAGHASC